MANTFSMIQGPYGRIEVVEYNHNLVVHSHSTTHLGFWLDGGGAHAHIGNQRIDYGPHMAIGINSFASHSLCLNNPKEPAIFLMLYIYDEWLDQCLHYLGQPVLFPEAQIEISPWIHDACWKLLRILVSPSRQESLCVEKEVLTLLQNTLGNAEVFGVSSSPRLRRKMVDYRLRKAMAHMRTHISSPCLADEVAEVVGLSRSRFFELFHDELKTSPSVFWNSIRYEEALKRLQSNQENMTSMAMELGFSSPGNFSRFFREHMGVSPSTVRRVCHAY